MRFKHRKEVPAWRSFKYIPFDFPPASPVRSDSTMNVMNGAAEKFQQAMNLLLDLDEIQCSHPQFKQFHIQLNSEICLYGEVIHPQAIDLFQQIRDILAHHKYVQSAEDFRPILPALIQNCLKAQRYAKQLRDQYKIVTTRIKRMEKQTTVAEINATQDAKQSDIRDTVKKVGGCVTGAGGACSGVGAFVAGGAEVAVLGAAVPVALPLAVVGVAGIVVSATFFILAKGDGKDAKQSKALANALNRLTRGLHLVSEVVVAVSQVLNSISIELKDITFGEENNSSGSSSSMTHTKVDMYIRRTRGVAGTVIPAIDSILSDNVGFEAWLGLFCDMEVEPFFKEKWIQEVHPSKNLVC